MKFKLDGLPIWFPYESIYPEQFDYMVSLKRSLDASGPCMLEMPSGTGKTVTLLSLITAYQNAHPNLGKLLYCSRTVAEVEKVVGELKRLDEYRHSQEPGMNRMTCVTLSSRKNLCINEDVPVSRGSNLNVDTSCLKLTASWVREQSVIDNSTPTCPFYETLERLSPEGLIGTGIYSLSDLKDIGRKNSICPYFLARRVLKMANIVVFTYPYLLDPKVSSLLAEEFPNDAIVVFDEAHNIDTVCTDALSVSLSTVSLAEAKKAVERIEIALETPESAIIDRLQSDYRRIVREAVAEVATEQSVSDRVLASSILPKEAREESIPGNIRQGKHFVRICKRAIRSLRAVLSTPHEAPLSPLILRSSVQKDLCSDLSAFGFMADRLFLLLRSLRIIDEEIFPLQVVCSFLDGLGTQDGGFAIVFESRLGAKGDETRLQLQCLDPSLVMTPVVARYRSVVITSGTLSPLNMYAKLLKITPVVSKAFPMSLHRDSVRPLIITRGADQVAMSSQFSVRENPAIVRNFGSLLASLCTVVPDGVVCFFPSYEYMQATVLAWSETKTLHEVLGSKLLFVETPNAAESARIVSQYKRACDSGRGALLLAVARGKLSEGVDFVDHYGRAIVVLGVPYQCTLSRALQARVTYVRDYLGIAENEFLSFDAMRTAAQCVGRAIRCKTDYGLLVFVDKRYHRKDKLRQLPSWISHSLHSTHTNLSTDMAVSVAKQFFLSMAESFENNTAGMRGTSVLNEEDVLKLCMSHQQ